MDGFIHCCTIYLWRVAHMFQDISEPLVLFVSMKNACKLKSVTKEIAKAVAIAPYLRSCEP